MAILRAKASIKNGQSLSLSIAFLRRHFASLNASVNASFFLFQITGYLPRATSRPGNVALPRLRTRPPGVNVIKLFSSSIDVSTLA